MNDTGLRLMFGAVSIQNFDKTSSDYLGFDEFGLENASDISSELVFYLPYVNLLRYEVRTRMLVGSPLTITSLGSIIRRSTIRQITRIEIFGATLLLASGFRPPTDSLNLEVLND